MKRSFSLPGGRLIVAGTALIAVTYGLVRLAYGLFLPDVQRELHLDAGVAGWVSSGASAMYCVGALAGFLLARARARSLVAVSAVTAAVGAGGAAVSPDAAWFAVAVVVGSASAGTASPALVRIVEERVDRSGVGRAQALVNSGTGPGLVAAGVLALVLLPDWRTAWAWSAGVALLVGAAVLVTAGPAARRGEPSGSSRGGSRRGGRDSGVLPDAGWFRAHAQPLVVALLFGAGTASVWTFGRSVLDDAGSPPWLSVTLWIAVGTGGAAVTVTSRWTGGLAARTLWRLTGTAAAVAVVVLGLVPRVPVLPLVAGAVFGWGYTAATGALIAWTTELAPDRAAAGTAVLFVVLVLGQAVGAAALGGLVTGIGAAGAFAVAAVATVLGAAAPLGRRRSEDRAELDLPVARP